MTAVPAGLRRCGRSAAVLLACALALAGCETGRPAGERAPTAAVEAEDGAAARQGAEAPAGGALEALQPRSDQSPQDLGEAEIYRGSGVLARAPRAAKVDVEIAEGGRVTLNFVDAEIREVVDAVLGGTLGVNYVVAPEVSGMVTARTSQPLARERVIPALENILAMHGVAVTYTDGVYKVQPLEKAARDLTVPVVTRGAVDLQRGFAVHVIPLDYVSAAALHQTLQDFVAPGRILRADAERNLLVFAGPGPEARDLAEMVEVFDVDWMAGMSFALYPLQIAQAKDVIAELESVFGQDVEGPLAGMVRFLPIERLNAVLAITPQSAYLDKAETWIDRLDRGGGGTERRVFVYFVQNVRADELAQVLSEAFGGGVAVEERPPGEVAPGLRPTEIAPEAASEPTTGEGARQQGAGERGQSAQAEGGEAAGEPAAGEAAQPEPTARPRARAAAAGESVRAVGALEDVRIIADDKRNALIILATAEQYRMIERTLRRLDIVPLQVLIEATILEVSLTDELRYGLNWFFSSGNNELTFSTAGGAVAPLFTGDPGAGFSYLFDSGDVRLVLNALKEITDINVVSSPQLLVLDNQSARLQVGDQVPVATQSAVSVIDPEAPVVNSIQFRDTGVILEVTPRVNASGLVVLEILQEVSDVVQTTTSTLNSPTIQQRTIESTVAVQSGDTVALGGLIRDNQSDGETGVPILASIPILGNLFKVTTRNISRTELLVLLTPRVVRDRGEARAVTRELRRRMSTVAPLEERVGLSPPE